MLGRKEFEERREASRSRISAEVSQSRLNDVLDQKDREIARLTKTIKKLKKQLKEKEQLAKISIKPEGNNAYFKVLLQKEVNRYNELRDVLFDMAQRIKKLSLQINSEFSIFQSNASMQNIVNMLENSNISRSYTMSDSDYSEEESVNAERVMDEFEVVVRGLMMKHGQMHKINKETLVGNQQLQEEIKSIQKELKTQKKSKDLLQSLLQKSETQKNQLINQINSISTKQQIDELRLKSKEQIIFGYFKLQYRIRDLEKEKQEFMKSSNRDKQKEVRLYETLLSQVRNMKDKQRSRQSVM